MSFKDTQLYAYITQGRLQISPKFYAILEVAFEVPIADRRTDRTLTSIIWTSDGHLMGMERGDCGFNEFLGMDSVDMLRNLRGVCDAVDETPEGTQAVIDQVFSFSGRQLVA